MADRDPTEFPVSHHEHLIAASGTPEFSWQRWVRVFLTSLVAFCLGIALLNFVVNPLSLYPLHLLRSPVWDSRHEKVLLMADARAQVIILGSSHAMKLSPAVVHKALGLTAFNAAVDMATIDDEFALLRLAVEGRNWPLSLALIAIDPETFTQTERNSSALAGERALAKYVSYPSSLSPPWERAATLISGEQTQTSLKTLNWLRQGAPRARYFDRDGYLHWQSFEQQRARGTFDLAHSVESTAESLVIRYRAMVGLSPQSKNSFEEMLRYCGIHHIHVKLFIAPLHPSARNALSASSYDRVLRETVSYARTAAAANAAEIYDLSDLSAFQGRPEAFYDGEHVDSVNADLLAARILRPEGSHAIQ